MARYGGNGALALFGSGRSVFGRGRSALQQFLLRRSWPPIVSSRRRGRARAARERARRARAGPAARSRRRGRPGARARARARAARVGRRAEGPRSRCSSSGTAARRCCASCAPRREAPEVDPASPYFAHLRLREAGRERDVCLGKATCIRGGVRDRRLAPRAGLAALLPLRAGRRYEEEIGGARARGEVDGAPHGHDPRRGELERVDAPEGIFVPRSARRLAACRQRAAAAARGRRGRGAARVRARRGRPSAGSAPILDGARRADKRLPDIAGLIDPEQFDAIDPAASGFVVDPRHRGLGQDHRRAAPHRVPRLRRPGDRLADDAVRGVLAGAARLRERTCCRRSASRTCTCAPSATGRASSCGASSRACRATARGHARVVHRLKLAPGARAALGATSRAHAGRRRRPRRRSTTGRACSRDAALLEEVLPRSAADAFTADELRARRRLVPRARTRS